MSAFGAKRTSDQVAACFNFDANDPFRTSAALANGSQVVKSFRYLLTDPRQFDKLLDNYAQYQTVIALENSDYRTNAAEAIKTLCNEMRAQGEKIVGGMEQDVRARWEEVVKNAKLNETRFIGVLGEEPTICYAAVLARAVVDGTEKTQVIVYATTIVGGKLVYLYQFAPDVSGNSIADVFALVKAQTVRFKAAN